MKILILSLSLIFSTTVFCQVIPYNTTPDWESSALGHIATGLGLADINGDGYKDLVCANGNDIQRQHLVVYYNNGDGSFPDEPSWQSADIDYHGHLAVGDIDKDGYIDVAVSVYIGPTGFNSPGKVKVYYNQSGALETSPSFESVEFYTFSCALGDADGDGDLDLAAAAGEPYGELFDYGKVFINEGGTFQPEPQWESTILMGALDVEFGDLNMDRRLDLAFACEYTDNYIYLAQIGTGIPTSPSWSSTEGENFINSVDIGYRNEPAEAIMVMSENDQLGGSGRMRMYDFGAGVPAASSADWYSNSFGYGSGIFLYDVDMDGILDLLYGGWWLPLKIALGDGSGFQLTPSYTSSTSSVVEAIQLADLGKESVMEKTETIAMIADGGNCIILEEQVVEEIVSITWNGNLLDYEQYTWVPNKNWVAFTLPFLGPITLEITYRYSPHADIVITNWDGTKGNYIFYNTNPPVSVEEQIPGDPSRYKFWAYPQPAGDFIRVQEYRLSDGFQSVHLYDLAGREHTIPWTWDNGEIFLSTIGLEAGAYILTIRKKHRSLSGKILIR